jgi:HlyD family secretion protein
MFHDSLVSPQAYDEALTKFNIAHSQYEAAAAKKQEITGGIRDEQVHMALGQKRQAEGALLEAHVAYNERIIIAPKNMSIETIALHEGELALPGYNIFIGYEINSTYFRFTVSESLVQNFVRDSIYKIELPFMKGKIINARLTAINELGRYAFKTTSFPNYQLGEAVYELKLIPDDEIGVQKLYVNGSAILKKSIQ